MYYASIGVLAIIMHIIVHADVLFGSFKSDHKVAHTSYRAFLFSIMLYYVSDILWGILYEAGNIPITYADTVLYFVSMALTLVLWIRFTVVYLQSNGRLGKFIQAVSWLLLAAMLGSLIINGFIPFMFHFSEDGTYHADIARYVILIIQVAIFVILGLYSIIHAFISSASKRLQYCAIGVSGLVMAVFVVLQAVYPFLPLYAVGCLFATSIINTYVGVDERMNSISRLGTMERAAYKDTLTSVRNANAFKEKRKAYDEMIKLGEIKEFAVAVFDLNDLKKVNDTQGHEAGDRYIQSGCRLICITFDHSPVFRIGGDEFVAVLMNSDYENRENLINYFNSEIEDNLKHGKVVVSAGVGIFDPDIDECFDDVFKRADEMMYLRKQELKSRSAK